MFRRLVLCVLFLYQMTLTSEMHFEMHFVLCCDELLALFITLVSINYFNGSEENSDKG